MKKKNIPKFTKKLTGFLSDENGKITKEDVLKMGLITMGIAGITYSDSVVAAENHSNVTYSHSNLCAGHGSGTGNDAFPGTSVHANSGTWYRAPVANTVNVSPINGHLSYNPGITYAAMAHANGVGHGSHTSHGSHGQW